MDTAAQQLTSTPREHDLLKSFVRLSLNPWSLFSFEAELPSGREELADLSKKPFENPSVTLAKCL